MRYLERFHICILSEYDGQLSIESFNVITSIDISYAIATTLHNNIIVINFKNDNISLIYFVY